MGKTDSIRKANREREWTPEMRAHMSEIKSAERNGFFGKTHAAETRAVMSEKAKERVKLFPVPSRLADEGIDPGDTPPKRKREINGARFTKPFCPRTSFGIPKRSVKSITRSITGARR